MFVVSYKVINALSYDKSGKIPAYQGMGNICSHIAGAVRDDEISVFIYVRVSSSRVSFYGFLYSRCSFYRNICSKSWTYANEAVKILGGRVGVLDESAQR